jgi:hypothetical protein
LSREIGMDCIRLRPTPRLGHTEYAFTHVALIEHATGLDADNGQAQRRFFDNWDFDLMWGTSDGPIDWAQRGRTTDMGHAVYYADGRDLRQPKACPFETVEDVYSFDPAAEYGLVDFDELVDYYESEHQARRAAFPNQVVTGGYYKSVISGAIQAFGWEMLLLAAANADRFARVLERFGAYTMHYVRAWAQTSAEVFIQHDDMVWTQGPFMYPDFYRRAIFPLYKQFWRVLKDAGKKVLYCSDGTFDMFIDDLADCGADGFIFEPSNSLERFVEKCGDTHCLVGSKVDCRTLAFGSWAEVKRQIDATLELARRCRGFIFAVGNHIPANVPVEMCDRYMDYLRRTWVRTS